MQYCSLKHWTLLPSPVTSTKGCCFCFGSLASFFLELFLHWSPIAYWAPTDLESSSLSVLYFCLFILFMQFSRQEYWSGLPFPSPVDHVLSNNQAQLSDWTDTDTEPAIFSVSGFLNKVPSLPQHLISDLLAYSAARRVSLDSVQWRSHIQLFETPWTTASQASLSITIFKSLLKLTSIKSVMPSNHLIFSYFFLFLPSIFPSIRVFSNESVLRIRWPQYWNFSFSISLSNEYSGLISFRTGLISLQSKGLLRVFSNTKVQKHQFFGTQLSSWSNFHIHSWLLEKP